MSTHNICFHGEIRKILYGYPLLSVAMKYMYTQKEDTNQPAIMHSLIRVFVVHMKKVFILGYPKKHSEDSNQNVNAQADLNLHWVYMSEGTYLTLWLKCPKIFNTLFATSIVFMHLLHKILGHWQTVRTSIRLTLNLFFLLSN